MKEYFKDEKIKKYKLSEYLKMPKTEFKYHVCDEKYKEPRIKYIMGILGDIELDKDTYISFMRQFDCSGGRYDVLTEKETIQGIYSFSQKYPFLAADGLELIWIMYIQDLFEAYSLETKLGEFFKHYGKTDEAMEKYYEYVNKIADEYEKQYYEEAAKLDKTCKGYDPRLIKHLGWIIKRQHILADDIIKCLPSPELTYKDMEQLNEIIRETRIYFGACHPISYQMIESLVTKKSLDRYPEQPKYWINHSRTIDTTFTKQEFLDSIEEMALKREAQKVKK